MTNLPTWSAPESQSAPNVQDDRLDVARPSTQFGPSDVAALVPDAVALAMRWEAETEAGATKSERATTEQLAALLRDEAGLALAVKFVDEVARPEDPYVASKVLSRLTTGDAAFLGTVDRGLLGIGAKAAALVPPVVVPIARKRLRQIVGHLIVDVNDPTLGKHLAKAKADGFRLNVNLLGEAVLGEKESASRAERTRRLLERPDVDYVSIKVSSLVSQISTWDTDGSVKRCLKRLRPLYRTAVARTPHAFVNLDMEEYRDLDLTMEVFERVLREPEFHQMEGGIVLQAYLPDAIPALERMLTFARERRANGHAGIKVRVVKGANLAMEAVEAEVHGWRQAPYTSKEDVDANYLNFVERALRPENAEVLRIGVASHNLFDTAVAHLLAKQRGVSDSLDIEMLQGMAPAQARAVRADTGSVLLYTPVVAPKDFDVAVSYLIRRLEENAQPQNFLHAMFSQDTHGEGTPMQAQERRFRESVVAMTSTPVGPRRCQERPAITELFDNTAESDPALGSVREWAAAALDAKPAGLTSPVLESVAAVDESVARAVAAASSWASRPGAERASILREGARQMQNRWGELITVMAAEGGKTIDQGDPEVSEAIDFARYYADRAEELEPGHTMTDGARFTPDRVVLITPPWNFPVAIPTGGVLAALAAGASVIIKPAGPVPGCSEVTVAALWDAGVPRDVLQIVRAGEREVGRHLVSHPDIDTVILTGATDTAKLFASWRAGRERGSRVFGETSGKNALIVTPAADLDLAAADLMKSAFGHAGQKCSAASLSILVGSVVKSQRFRRQLVDAVASLRVGWPDDLETTMGPIIEPPSGKLLRALTTLDPGESWLVEPRKLDDTGRLWSPGLKTGVKPGSFFHLTEVFGPVLGLMEASSLEEAVEWQNATEFGLTGGIHSLDPDEIEYWTENVQVGNAYINRVITGAIVQRQSFGGWKGSAVGPGAKAGAPNYVAQLGHWEADGPPRKLVAPSPRVKQSARVMAPLATTDEEREWLDAALASDSYAWREEFGLEHDESALHAESNVFRYRPLPLLLVRCEPNTRWVELARVLLAAELAATPVRVSLDPGVSDALDQHLSATGVGRQLADHLAGLRVSQPRDTFITGLGSEPAGFRIRVLGDVSAVAHDLDGTTITVLADPVLANGRRELLTVHREQAVSRTLHRYGHVSPELSR